jgi:hypothetical protein
MAELSGGRTADRGRAITTRSAVRRQDAHLKWQNGGSRQSDYNLRKGRALGEKIETWQNGGSRQSDYNQIAIALIFWAPDVAERRIAAERLQRLEGIVQVFTHTVSGRTADRGRAITTILNSTKQHICYIVAERRIAAERLQRERMRALLRGRDRGRAADCDRAISTRQICICYHQISCCGRAADRDRAILTRGNLAWNRKRAGVTSPGVARERLQRGGHGLYPFLMTSWVARAEIASVRFQPSRECFSGESVIVVARHGIARERFQQHCELHLLKELADGGNAQDRAGAFSTGCGKLLPQLPLE